MKVVFDESGFDETCTLPTLLLERLHLLLQIMVATCEGCHAPLDFLGHGSCPRSGRVMRRATPTEP